MLPDIGNAARGGWGTMTHTPSFCNGLRYSVINHALQIEKVSLSKVPYSRSHRKAVAELGMISLAPSSRLG